MIIHKYFILTIILSFSGSCIICAANPDGRSHYVRAGADGRNDGSDWANAYTQLPSKLIRGEVYYIADGSYPGYNFADATNGRKYIFIKKATEAEHGANIGWKYEYGNGQAEFGPLTFSTGHYVIDGQCGGGYNNWTRGYGFKIKGTAAHQQLIRFGNGISMADAVGNILVRHAELAHRGRNTETADDGIYGFYARNITVSHCYLHDFGRAPILMRAWHNAVIEHCHIARNSSSPANHSAGLSDSGSDSIIIRHNVWKDIEGTAVIDVLEDGGASADWQIYGNVIFHSAEYGTSPNNEGLSGFIRVLNDANNQAVANNWKIHNNSIVNIVGLWSGIRIDAGSNNVACNNLWYNSVRTAHLGVSISHSWYGKTPRDGDNNKVQIGTGDPFADSACEDFRLAIPTASGISLKNPFDDDMIGTVRGADGNWDRGAIEHLDVRFNAAPRPPTNAKVVNSKIRR